MNKNLLFLLLFISTFDFCQNAPWMNFNTTNSLMPSNQVNAIAIDPQGVKWIAAESGFVKYDNNTMVVYNKSNSALKCPHPLGVAIDQQGIKWLATFCQGLVKFDGTTFTIYDSVSSPLPFRTLTSIAIDLNNVIWAGMIYGGIARFDGSNWTFYNKTNSSLPSNYIKSVSVDAQNNKWFGTDNGLVKYDGANWTKYNSSNSGLPDNNVLSIAVDNSGNKWIGTYSGGMAELNDGGWAIYDTLNSGLTCNTVYSISADKQNTLWIGTCHGGLHKFDGTNWTVYNASNSDLPGNWTTVIAVESNGNKWIGLHDYGLSAYNESGVILPVELTKFSGIVSNRDILISWSTATEENSSGFEIERRTPSTNWEKISEIKAAGNSTSAKNYFYTDKGLINGEYYYRLKMTDLDGKFKYSNEIQVSVNAKDEFALNQNYPNPFNPTTTINYSIAKGGNVLLTVYNAIGSKLMVVVNEYKPAGNYSVQFDGSSFAGGIYFYRLESGGYSLVKKLILLK